MPKTSFCLIVATVCLDSLTACGILVKSDEMMVILATSIAMSEPLPMAILTSGCQSCTVINAVTNHCYCFAFLLQFFYKIGFVLWQYFGFVMFNACLLGNGSCCGFVIALSIYKSMPISCISLIACADVFILSEIAITERACLLSGKPNNGFG